ncbi:MAG: hypothetical protein AUH78_23095 [Gemmatimonadetes bacterium 13_1_40CM_4_69_8]|nr:MAG: hypothetical protein AUH78_23095 [Gemmatimonadetes bacterium 13_1_40CM_4_69_8]
MLVASLATLVRAYLAVKLLFLALFLGAALLSMAQRRRVFVYPRLVGFYLILGVVGIVWAVVGLLHQGNYVSGVLDAVRLYVIWSLAFVVVYTLLRSEASLGAIHAALILAGILISLINFVGLADVVAGWGLVSETIREELNLYVGVHEDYLQVNSVNISALFVIVPYLLAVQVRADALSLILTMVSGRRALWLVVALVPGTILLLAIVTGGLGVMRRGARRFLLGYVAAAVLGAAAAPMLPARLQEVGPVRRLVGAFSAADERAIQKPYLLEGFARSPALGSGFGAYAGYLRSEEAPWSYELTYYVMLFNLGIVGVAALGTLFAVYFVFVCRLLSRFKEGAAVPFALLVGLCSLLMGAYSNPYFGGFDSLFFIGLLPYLSTFRAGFDRPAPAATAAS